MDYPWGSRSWGARGRKGAFCGSATPTSRPPTGAAPRSSRPPLPLPLILSPPRGGGGGGLPRRGGGGGGGGGGGRLGHRDAGGNEGPGQRINRQGELLERHGAEQREASRGSEQAGRVEVPAVDGEQDPGRRPLLLASVREHDRHTP